MRLFRELLVCPACGTDYRRYGDPRIYFIQVPRDRPAPDPTRCPQSSLSRRRGYHVCGALLLRSN